MLIKIEDSSKNCWLKVPVGEDKWPYCLSSRFGENRLFICVSRSIKTTTEYHEETIAKTFKDWFSNRFLNYLEEGSIITMENAPYLKSKIQRRLLEKASL